MILNFFSLIDSLVFVPSCSEIIYSPKVLPISESFTRTLRMLINGTELCNRILDCY